MRARATALLWLLALVSGTAVLHAEATIVIVNQDAPGEGLNDQTPFAGEGGNDASTLGEARLRAVEFGVAVWANSIQSTVPIRLAVRFDPLGGTPNSAVLAQGGPADIYRDFAGAPFAATWYASALADKLAGVDLSAGAAVDAEIVFNVDVDGPTVLGGSRFYYGLDANPSDDDVDLVTITAHELTHGLGFVEYLNRATGAKLLGYDDVFMRELEHHGATPADFPSMSDAQRLTAMTSGPDIHWTGANVLALTGGLTGGVDPSGHLQMYAPGPEVSGSSLSHFDTAVAPDEFMEPFYIDFRLDLDLVLATFADIGWGDPAVCLPGGTP